MENDQDKVADQLPEALSEKLNSTTIEERADRPVDSVQLKAKKTTKKIIIKQARRSRMKNVTIISNLEQFGISVFLF